MTVFAVQRRSVLLPNSPTNSDVPLLLMPSAAPIASVKPYSVPLMPRSEKPPSWSES